LAKAAELNKIEDQLLVLIRRQVETELELEEKFRELCEEVSNVVKEREDVVQELERLSGNHVAKETARLLRRRQKRDLYKMTGLHIMVNESHLNVREKHTFVSKMNLETLVDQVVVKDVLYSRVNELRLLISELNVFGGPLVVQCAEFLKQLSQKEVLQMLELRKMIAEVHL
ncbi:hypothetical protein Tco_1040531, partial [Tanacetum coccineum]